ncbi:MAG: AAA family ATPase [Cyclobacteriaceae bacterium]
MVKGFVFGKFLPFHRGHEAMIRFALTHCDLLSVLICCSDQEKPDGNTRSRWITSTFVNEKRVEVKVFNYSEIDLPNTSESSRAVSQQWARVFKELYPDFGVVVTSEPYGKFVADFMGIRHIPFDPSRRLFPISATDIRTNFRAYWGFLPEIVKQDYALKVVILGTESVGKTTLAQQLAEYYQCSLVLEAGRDLIADSQEFSYADLEQVASEHARRIDEATYGNSPLVIIDTDIHITKSYARFKFNRELVVSDGVYQTNLAQLYLYLTKETKYVQDGTRLSRSQRDLLDQSHRKILDEHGVNFKEIAGNYSERYHQAVYFIDKLLS